MTGTIHVPNSFFYVIAILLFVADYTYMVKNMIQPMATEGNKDSLDWKSIGDSAKSEPDAGPVVKKRLPKKMRHIPDYYFLPRRSMLANIVIYGSCIVGGIGAGMLTEIWINKKVQEDGNGVLWEFDK